MSASVEMSLWLGRVLGSAVVWDGVMRVEDEEKEAGRRSVEPRKLTQGRGSLGV